MSRTHKKLFLNYMRALLRDIDTYALEYELKYWVHRS